MASPFDALVKELNREPEKGRKRQPGENINAGELNTRAKLTEEQVRAIFNDPRRGYARRDCAREYGVSVETVKSIQYGHTWKHLELTSKSKS